MANTVQIKCVNRTERMSPHERITHVGGYVSSQWKITLNDAIGKIESGERAFFVQAHRRTVGVIVALSPSGKKYLKTEADGISRILFCGSPNAHNDRVRRSNPLRFDCSRQHSVIFPVLGTQVDFLLPTLKKHCLMALRVAHRFAFERHASALCENAVPTAI